MFNAYETLNLEPKFTYELPALEKAYICRIKQIHPDKQGNQTEEQRKKALEEAAKVNEAYRILKDPLLRAQHLLELRHPSISPEPSVSSEILSESLILRELLAEAKTGKEIEIPLKDIHLKIERLLKDLQTAFTMDDRVKSSTLIAHLTYLKKFVQEAQDKLWSFEDQAER